MFAGPAFGSEDKEDANITTEMCTPAAVCWVVNANNKPEQATIYFYLATTNLIANHLHQAGTNQGFSAADIAHFHFFPNANPLTENTSPKLSQVNAFWNARFEKDGTPKNPQKITDAWLGIDCHTWALQQAKAANPSKAAGIYNYPSIPDVKGIFDADMKDLGVKNNGVTPADVLFYPSNGHSSSVAETRPAPAPATTGGEPSKIRWKWAFSGIYEYAQTTATWSTPMWQCGYDGDVDKDKVITEQGWAWTPDFRKDPNVLTKP